MKSFHVLSASLVFTFVILVAGIVVAATTDFTADSNVTVESVTFGAGTADMLIMNGSTAESWQFSSGTFTVTNPGSFRVGSSDATVKSIAINLGASLVECSANTTPGTSSVTLPTTAGTYTIEPSASTSCSSSLCSAVANAASLNAYPTCGAASCNTGYYLVGSGSGATCAQIPGGGAPAALSSGSGASTATIGIGETRNIGSVSQNGNNVFIYINASADFMIRVSGGTDESHTVKLSELDIANKIIELLVSSESQRVILSEGASTMVDLNGDDIDDIEITFNALTVNKVDLTIAALSSSVQDADLVKGPNSDAVYLIKGSSKHVFPDSKTYFTWYKDFSGIIEASIDTLDNYTTGDAVMYRPGTKLVTHPNTERVYAVENGGILRWISDEATALTLYGAEWANRVQDVHELTFGQYTIGDDMTADAHSVGTLIKPADDSTTYCFDGTELQSISSSIFDSNNFYTDDVVELEDISQYTIGNNISSIDDCYSSN